MEDVPKRRSTADMPLRALFLSVGLFVSGAAAGVGGFVLWLPSSSPSTVAAPPHAEAVGAVADDGVATAASDVSGSVPLPTSMSLEDLVAEAVASRAIDREDMARRANSFTRPIPTDWPSIKALALEENAVEASMWDRLSHWESLDDPNNDGLLQTRERILESVKRVLRVRVDSDSEQRINRTGDYRLEKPTDAFLGPEMAKLCEPGDIGCSSPIIVNFLCDMSQPISCQTIARAIRQSEEMFLFYPFETDGNMLQRGPDVTMLYGRFMKTEQRHALYVANDFGFTDSSHLVFDFTSNKSFYSPDEVRAKGLMSHVFTDVDAIQVSIERFVRAGRE